MERTASAGYGDNWRYKDELGKISQLEDMESSMHGHFLFPILLGASVWIYFGRKNMNLFCVSVMLNVVLHWKLYDNISIFSYLTLI